MVMVVGGRTLFCWRRQSHRILMGMTVHVATGWILVVAWLLRMFVGCLRLCLGRTLRRVMGCFGYIRFQKQRSSRSSWQRGWGYRDSFTVHL